MHPALAQYLVAWRKESLYAKDNDWIFPSYRLKGKVPRSASTCAKTEYARREGDRRRGRIAATVSCPQRLLMLRGRIHPLSSWLSASPCPTRGPDPEPGKVLRLLKSIIHVKARGLK